MHDVQRLTLRQESAARLTQLVTFTSIECASSDDCIGTRGGSVQLIYNGKLSTEITLATATAADIEAAFLPLRDAAYSGVSATVVSVGSGSVTWRLELITPWAACANQWSLPLLSLRCSAKVTAQVVRESLATCLSGGVYLTLEEHPGERRHTRACAPAAAAKAPRAPAHAATTWPVSGWRVLLKRSAEAFR